MTQRILVIEDDPSVRTLLERGLAYEGYLVEAAEDGETGLEIARDRPADLIVLDVMLPGIDGLEVLRRLRSVDDDLPVILLTARDRPEHQVEGLEAGADDYVTKPFSFDVLLARVRTQLRRRDKMPEVLRFEDITLDAATHTVKRGERDITFTGQEFRLMQAFMEQPERVQSKSVLLDRAWGVDYLGDPNIVETYIKLLRQKLEAEGESRVIHTIRGVGYVLRSG
ncbi:DNA-binding response regulator [Deinococcus cavernae]|uniref:DNA-binding response regulator n=1 Tax=Deinococcus cavernae TaxID=2320857 RepID=A0A418VH31_9DEIO|nr:response regulator transcription factor [Deinococcus cavernae]RJF75337.1 DNA-binding response regulator [Deinococcus cavernae]